MTGVDSLEGEVWKEIPLDTRYLVSNKGRVLSTVKNPRVIGSKGDPLQYCTVTIKGKPRVIHRLVASAFIENPESKAIVNHINGIRNDNKVDNLEWATESENIRHAHDTGLWCGKKHHLHYISRKNFADICHHMLSDSWEDDMGHTLRSSYWAIRRHDDVCVHYAAIYGCSDLYAKVAKLRPFVKRSERLK